MSPSLLISTIILFILSLVISLVLAMSAKKLNDNFLKYFAAIHFILFLIAIISTIAFEESITAHYSTLLTCCSGIMLSGYVLRREILHPLLKYYFSFFLISIAIFLYSPSHLFYFISGNVSHIEAEQQFRLKDNYYLVEQQSMLKIAAENCTYKVIQKFGIYNRTIARDINFKGKLYNASLIMFTNDTLILNGTLVNNESKLIGIHPGMDANTITRKRN